MKGFAPAMTGLSNTRWRNARSLVNFAMQHVGIPHLPGRGGEPLSPVWSDLFYRLPTFGMKTGLTRFARYCSAQDILPEDVDDAVMTTFHRDMLTTGLVGKPNAVHRAACRVWNEAADSIAGWPQRRLAMPSYSQTFRLAWDAFPPSLLADAIAYMDRPEGIDLEGDMDLRPLRAITAEKRLTRLRACASMLVHAGWDPKSLCGLADMVTVEAVKACLNFQIERQGGKRSPGLSDLAHMLQTIARHWAKVPPDHLEALRTISRRLSPGPRGMTEKNRRRLRQLNDPKNVQSLLSLPRTVFAEAARIPSPSHAEVVEVQSALAVELLQMLPMRIGNLAGLDISRHFKRHRGGIQIVIPPGEVKNNREIEADLPRETVQLIDLYLKRYRPMLPDGQGTTWLFPGRNAQPKCTRTLGIQIGNCVRRRCGMAVNAHLFRHISAKLYLEEHPGQFDVVRLIHGHASDTTTKRFYSGTEMLAAAKQFDAFITAKRDGARRPARRSSTVGQRP